MDNKKIKKMQIISRVILILAGSLILAFGTAAFLTPFDIVSGGISGIGILVDKGFKNIGIKFSTIDITVWILNLIFLFLSLLFLGRKFTISTLVATFSYPAFLTIFMRCGVSDFFYNSLLNSLSDKRPSILIAALIGGILNGFGIGITFIGEGSTGGFDILCFILNKYFNIKVSISTFFIDFVIILVGIFILGFGEYDYGLYSCLCGILTALITSIVIRLIYTESNSIYIADIISEKEKDISEYVHKKLNRTTTVLKGKGSYLGKEVNIIRCVFEKRELNELKEAISIIDSKAFITIYSGRTVYGEGFNDLKPLLLESFALKKSKETDKDKNIK